jgi:hypothetical protein
MKYWEIIADNLSKPGWSWGCVSAIDSSGRTFWIADAHRDDGKPFVDRSSFDPARHCALFVSVCHCRVESKRGRIRCMKYWEIIADNLNSLNEARL